MDSSSLRERQKERRRARIYSVALDLFKRGGFQATTATDIAKALQLAPDDAAVQLEAGNIAALAGDAAKAKERWAEALRLQPDGPTGKAAAAALKQFDGPAPPAP